MQLLFALALLALPYVIRADTDVRSLQGLTHVTRERTGRKGDANGKYFHESTFHPHYDGRFAEDILPEHERRIHLSRLVKTYLSTMRDVGATTWIMHGSLLGWFWNRRIMPWDTDIDVQVSEDSIRYLADYYNMTVHHFRMPKLMWEEKDKNKVQLPLTTEGELEGRNYMLEINPHYTNGNTSDTLNVIDARWIDIETGLFIDITTLRQDREAQKVKQLGQMYCKDRHRYLEGQIFPLRDGDFEGVPVKIPYAYSQLLEEEYGPSALTRTIYEGHKFDREKAEWERLRPEHPDYVPESERSGKKKKEQPNRAKKPHRQGSGKTNKLVHKDRDEGAQFHQFPAGVPEQSGS